MKTKITTVSIVLLILFSLVLLSGCGNMENASSVDDVAIEKFDNTNYKDFASSVGLSLYNENSTESLKNDDTLYITDMHLPIIAKFNSNGKIRDFVMTVYYDYEQIDFQIGEDGISDKEYIFTLEDGYEITLPIYLPEEIEKDGAHKLLVSFCIGSDVHAMNLEEFSNWYGFQKVYDVVFDVENTTFVEITDFNAPDKTVDLLYSFSLNQDYSYSIIDTQIMPHPPKVLNAKCGETVDLMYNISNNVAGVVNNGEVLIIVSVGFKQVTIDGELYKLLTIPDGKTGMGDLKIQAPQDPGYYEVIAYAITNPFTKNTFDNNISSELQSSYRFTLCVCE